MDRDTECKTSTMSPAVRAAFLLSTGRRPITNRQRNSLEKWYRRFGRNQQTVELWAGGKWIEVEGLLRVVPGDRLKMYLPDDPEDVIFGEATSYGFFSAKHMSPAVEGYTMTQRQAECND
jgi:hypothetical protein